MMGPILHRRDSFRPFAEWSAFEPDCIVQVWNVDGESRIGPARSFWWGYEQTFGTTSEGVIVKARRLCAPRQAITQRSM